MSDAATRPGREGAPAARSRERADERTLGPAPESDGKLERRRVREFQQVAGNEGTASVRSEVR